MKANYKRQAGFNLVEVLIAMALLATVLIGIMSLFFFGQRNVYSGKQMTQAVSLGNNVLEDLTALNVAQRYAAFGITPTTPRATVTIDGVSYPNSIIRRTTEITAATDPAGLMNRWQTLMSDNYRFNNGRMTLVFTPTEDPANTPAQIQTATVHQLRVIVQWQEGRRARNMTVDSMKVRR
jgi:prepilin-type N-terminal cleavage/methylation domain-containing protein